jgi:putative acetyltransferase
MKGDEYMETNMEISLVRVDNRNQDFQKLIVSLDEDLSRLYGPIQKDFAQFNTVDNIQDVVVAYIEGNPAGCGAFKAYDAETVELKRIFVSVEYRRRGIAGLILRELELMATAKGFGSAILETGVLQPQAIQMYRKAGFELIPNYDPYRESPNSVCMWKNLASEKNC